MRKGEIASYKRFLLSSQCFLQLHVYTFNPLPDDKIWDWSKLKQSADDNFEFDVNSRKFSKRVENTVGKGEIARYEQFLLFPSVFKRLVSQGRQKVSLCGNGLRRRNASLYGNGLTKQSHPNDHEKQTIWKHWRRKREETLFSTFLEQSLKFSATVGFLPANYAFIWTV